jgi:hypothetical protein
MRVGLRLGLSRQRVLFVIFVMRIELEFAIAAITAAATLIAEMIGARIFGAPDADAG